jgi:hypothetical protein
MHGRRKVGDVTRMDLASGERCEVGHGHGDGVTLLGHDDRDGASMLTLTPAEARLLAIRLRDHADKAEGR